MKAMAGLPEIVSKLSAALLVVIVTGCATPSLKVSPPSDLELNRVVTNSDALPENSSGQGVYSWSELASARDIVSNSVGFDGYTADPIKALFRYMTSPDGLNIQYDVTANFPPADVLKKQRANCIAFSALFVVLARTMDYEVSFQEVDLPPRWLQRDDQSLMYFQHVNVRIDGGGRNNRVADFRVLRYDTNFPQQIISDSHAEVLFLVNDATELMLQGQMAESLSFFMSALKIDPAVSSLWGNLGVLYRRLERNDLAEISYRQALALDQKNYLSMNNLAALYEQPGRLAPAKKLRSRALFFRKKNPYYLYSLAQRAFDEKDYQESIELLNKAAKLQADEHRFQFLLAANYHQLDREGLWRKYLNNAIELAGREVEKVLYRKQMQEWETKKERLGGETTP